MNVREKVSQSRVCKGKQEDCVGRTDKQCYIQNHDSKSALTGDHCVRRVCSTRMRSFSNARLHYFVIGHVNFVKSCQKLRIPNTCVTGEKFHTFLGH